MGSGIDSSKDGCEKTASKRRPSEQLQKFGEHQQASTRLNFASKSSKGKILRAVKNFNGPFISLVLFCLRVLAIESIGMVCFKVLRARIEMRKNTPWDIPNTSRLWLSRPFAPLNYNKMACFFARQRKRAMMWVWRHMPLVPTSSRSLCGSRPLFWIEIMAANQTWTLRLKYL